MFNIIVDSVDGSKTFTLYSISREKITTEKDKKREILMTLELDIIIRISPIKSFEWCIFEEFPY